MIKLNTTAPVLLAALLAASSAHAETKRELGPHVHGHGKLDMALEGKKLLIELEAPAADIVGFEHAPSSDAEKKTAEKAHALLSEPLKLFVVPSAAGCKKISANIKRVVEDHHDGDGHAEKDHDHDKHKGEKHDGDHAEAQHSEYHANYTLECSAPAKLSTVTFKYFSTFKNARELEVQFIAPKGQSSYEATSKSPTITLKGIK